MKIIGSVEWSDFWGIADFVKAQIPANIPYRLSKVWNVPKLLDTNPL